MTIALHGARALPLILALQACASGSPAGDDPFSRQNAPRPVRIEVTNRNFADVTIWAVYPGDRLRLGTRDRETRRHARHSRKKGPRASLPGDGHAGWITLQDGHAHGRSGRRPPAGHLAGHQLHAGVPSKGFFTPGVARFAGR